ncbi:MAG: creatininase family protein [Rhizobiales bacterium]|nr:creatininase family protein [Hyphomicrobiales bacterium]
MELKSHWWWDLSAKDFAGLDMERIVAVLPVGAVEQHGPHLPVRVDAAINAGIVARAVEMMPADLPVLVLPMTPVGKSNEHVSYPGTLTLSHETLFRLWFEIGESVRRTGCRKMVIFNSHGGQPQVIDIVCRELRVRHGMFVVNAMWSRMTKHDDLFTPKELTHGIHGGEVETSVMLHLHRDKVDMAEAADFEPLSVALAEKGGLLTPEGGVGFGWQAQDLHPSGAMGDAASADAARGGVLVERAATALTQLCREVADYPLARLANETIYATK